MIFIFKITSLTKIRLKNTPSDEMKRKKRFTTNLETERIMRKCPIDSVMIETVCTVILTFVRKIKY